MDPRKFQGIFQKDMLCHQSRALLRIMENKPEIRKQDLINLNSICTAKETLKERPSEEEKYWQTKIPIMNWSAIHTNSSCSFIKNTNNLSTARWGGSAESFHFHFRFKRFVNKVSHLFYTNK